MKKQTLISTLLVWLLLQATGYSAEAAAPTISKVDQVFLFISAALVFLMQAGFCLVEMGFSRSKNAINIVMKNACDMSAGTIGFFLIGFSLMFGWSQGGFVGLGNFGFSDSFGGDHVIWFFFLFQVMFAATTVTISSGAMAERTYFPGYVLYAAVACALVYPLLGHWVWGGGSESFGFGGGQGWLAAKGFSDFAGSTVVHAMGGAFALAGIIVIGPRRGRFLADGSERIFAGHNIPLGALGMFLLFFGWFGFNCGSAITVGENIGLIAANTLIAGAAGLISGMIFHWLLKGWADPESAINGALGGLVSVTACCNVIAPWAAIVIGLIAGLITVLGGKILLKFKLDDAVGAIPVHLMCGIFGTICVSLFNQAEPFKNLSIQVLGAFIIPVAAFCIIWVIFMIIDKTIGLRASEEAQEQGLDFAEHSAAAYPDFATNDED